MLRVQINPLAPTSAPGWIPADFQSESRGPYFDSRSQSARPCATCRFQAMGVASPRIKAGLKQKNGQPVLKMFAAMLWIEPHRICDVTKSHEAITCRVPASSHPPTNLKLNCLDDNRTGDSAFPGTAAPSALCHTNGNAQTITAKSCQICPSPFWSTMGLILSRSSRGDCPALFCSISNSLRSRLFLRVEHEPRHSFCYSRIEDNFI